MERKLNFEDIQFRKRESKTTPLLPRWRTWIISAIICFMGTSLLIWLIISEAIKWINSGGSPFIFIVMFLMVLIYPIGLFIVIKYELHE